MSIEYWPIVIYGIKVKETMLDLQKVAELIGLESEEEMLINGVIGRHYFRDFLDALT